jgi:2-polyprenyl-3-methyl-5-hydroxy-6-metoxy-1,4-benzoquinol methylase
MDLQNETLDDFLAKQTIEGKRVSWIANQKKIAYVLRKTKKYFRGIYFSCDIGIGNGYTLKFFHGRGVKTTGADISSFLINYYKQEFLKEKLGINLIEADITKTKPGENSFDLVTCFDVLEHLPGEGLNSAVKNIAGSLKPNGLFIGTVPLRENLDQTRVICPECGTKFHPIGHHHSFQSFDEIKDMLISEFEILKFGEVPVVFTRILIFHSIGNFVFKLARRLILNQTISTAFFVARVKNK